MYENRSYLRTQFRYDNGTWDTQHFSIRAVEVQAGVAQRMRQVWIYKYTVQSSGGGDSATLEQLAPLLRTTESNVMYINDTDGICIVAVHQVYHALEDEVVVVFIRDKGESYEQLWNRSIVVGHPMFSFSKIVSFLADKHNIMHAIPTSNNYSITQDPREGFWIYSAGSPQLLRLSPTNGEVVQTIDVNDVLMMTTGEKSNSMLDSFVVASHVNICGIKDNPAMVFAALSVDTLINGGGSKNSRCFVVALGLESAALLWKYEIQDCVRGIPRGQFIVLHDSATDMQLVVFSTVADGIHAITSKQDSLVGG